MHTTTSTPPRHEQWDLGLSPREEMRMAGELMPAMIARRSRDTSKKFMLDEVGADALKKAGLPGRGNDSIIIPTHARMFKPGAIDIKAAAQRDALVAGTGGYLVGTELQPQSFIELLRNRMVALQMGATRLDGLTANVTIPRQTGGATAYWLATESSSLVEGNQTFDQVALTPNTVGAYTQISRLLQLQSTPDAQSIIMRDLAQQVALAADLAVIAGTGSEQPQGIIGTSGVGSFTGTSLGTAALLDAQTDVANANALTASCGYVTTSAVATLLLARQRFAGTAGDALWVGNVLDGQVLGMKAMSSNQCPAAHMVFGNWQELILGFWGVLEIAINPYDDFATGITGIRCFLTMDSVVRHAAAFSVATSIT